MGYQESLLFCEDIEALTKLCTLLNKAALDDSKEGLHFIGLEVLEVGRLKKTVTVVDPFCGDNQTWLAGSYFVWWGGERHPQSGDWIWDYMDKHFEPSYCSCWCVFAEYIPPVREMLDGIKADCPGEIQENEWIRTFHPDERGQINLELIEKL